LKQPLATDASERFPSFELLLHELRLTNLDFPSSVSSHLCPKIWVQYTPSSPRGPMSPLACFPAPGTEASGEPLLAEPLGARL
jgi:hypothetical protein